MWAVKCACFCVCKHVPWLVLTPAPGPEIRKSDLFNSERPHA